MHGNGAVRGYNTTLHSTGYSSQGLLTESTVASSSSVVLHSLLDQAARLPLGVTAPSPSPAVADYQTLPLCLPPPEPPTPPLIPPLPHTVIALTPCGRLGIVAGVISESTRPQDAATCFWRHTRARQDMVSSVMDSCAFAELPSPVRRAPLPPR